MKRVVPSILHCPPCLLGLLVSLVPATSSATLINADALDTLARTSDAVVIGEVVATEPFIADDGRVFTTVTVDPFGDAAPVQLLQLGGRTDDFATRFAGADLYVVGEQVLVFCELRDDGLWQSISLAFSKFSFVDQGGTPLLQRTFDVASLSAPPPPASLALEVVPAPVFTATLTVPEATDLIALAPRVIGQLP